MNQGNDHLFQLIHSMSSSEKRYFKRNALIAKDADANYLKLFDALNKMKVYDEAALVKKKIVKHLASERKYLYEVILRSLRNYSSEESVRAQISDLILDADNLFKRGLYDQSEKRLKKAHRLATEIGDLLILIEISNLRRRSIKLMKSRTYTQEIEDQIEEKDKLLSLLSKELYYVDIADRMFSWVIKNQSIKSEGEVEELKNTFLPVLKKEKYEDLSMEGKRQYDYSYGILYRLIEDVEYASQFFKNGLEWWTRNPIMRTQKFTSYVNSVSHYLGTLFRLNKHELIPQVIAEFDRLKINNYHDKSRAFLKSSLWKILYHFSSGDVLPISKLIPEIEAGVKKYQFSDYSKMTLEGNFITFYFLVEDWESCQERFEKIFTSKRLLQREGVLQKIRIISLVAYFEMEKVEKLEAGIRATQRFFEKTISDRERYEFKILGFFRKIMKAPYAEQEKQLEDFDNFLKNVSESFAEGDLETLPPNIEELRLWLRSKLENRSILKTFQQGLNL